MPHEVIMPALGMAQDSGQLLAWHKKPGEAVAAGDVLFEVETDKAAMEVEAQKEGYLTDVSVEAGSDVPVGQVIAMISETPEGAVEAGNAPSPEKAADTAEPAPGGMEAGEDELPDGHQVIMPTLGMAQDTGLLVAWCKQPGETVAADDILFEVETDKSTVEVNAGRDGFVAALLAEAGEEVPVGQAIAVISAQKPDKAVSRKAAGARTSAAGETAPERQEKTEPANTPAPSPEKRVAAKTAPGVAGRVLASPKARRLAQEQGLDLQRLADAGHPQPFHVKDLETLKTLRAETPAASATAQRFELRAEVSGTGFADFVAWAKDNGGQADQAALLAGFAAASFGNFPAKVRVENMWQSQAYSAASLWLGQVKPADDDQEVDLLVRDLRASRISALQLDAGKCPVISILRQGEDLALVLEWTGDRVTTPQAIDLLSNFAGRMEQPLRHLL
ncbi:biotin/lipoyl-containing protein [Roseibium aggregatum]|uniref:Dihydrolipoyllysine-residue acetyltransferase component of pyruvate dehydrogenase complex n=1 Tax=Roseibium aggregatum TaxID=187304 RepID=A0A0M6Y6U3_9HYPH|nr:biotin/lipoyl-containing protein [Roseibium aggregatum]CTQ45253.1 Dihydrolipoyllysine-residue acetyltransferase component of pyruvate dehydrogenase complex [Roseibium aggregatum]